MERSLPVASSHMNISSTWMAVSVSALKNTAVIITICTSVDRFSMIFRCSSLQPLQYVHSCADRGLLYTVTWALFPCCFFSQASRQKYMTYKLHTYPDKNVSSTSKLYFKYDPQILLRKIQGVCSKMQVVMNGVAIHITKSLLELVYSLRKSWNATVLEVSLAY